MSWAEGICLMAKAGALPLLLIASMAVSVLPLLFLNRIGQSYRLRHVAFPLWWTLAALCVVSGAVLWVLALRHDHSPLQPYGLAPLGVIGLICFGLPLIHRLSGFRPVEFEMLLRGWPSKAREELLAPLREHMLSLSFEIQPAERWKCDLAGMARVRGTTNPDVRIRYVAAVRLEPQPRGMLVRVRVDEMDICIKDTGESQNCMVLAQALFQRLQQPPYDTMLEVTRPLEHVKTGA